MHGKFLLLIYTLLLGLSQQADAAVTRFAYVANAYDSSLSIYRVEAHSGRLYPLGHVPLKQFPSSVVTHPSGRFLFVSAQTGMTVQVFAIDPVSGLLNEIEGSPFDPKVVSPFWLVTDPAGNFLYIAGRNSNAISAMRIDSRTGALTLINGAPFRGGYLPRAVAMHPDGGFVYMTNINDDSVSAWSIDKKSGGLKSVSGKAFPGGDAPQFMVLHPDGRRAWLNSWNSRSIIGYRVDPASGVLSVDYELALPDGIYPFGLAISGNGRFLYVAGWFGGIMAYQIDRQDGTLSPVPGAPFATFGNQPLQIFIEPGDRFAYVTNYESHTLSVYRINADSGALQAVQTVSSRIGPRAMAFVSGDAAATARGGQLFARDDRAGVVRIFDIDATDGGLRPAGELSLPAAMTHMTIDRDGRHLLAASRDEDRLYVWRRDQDKGWQPAAASTLAARGGPAAIAIDYNRRYAYAINRDSSTLSAYYLLPDTAALDEAPATALFPASPYETVKSPRDLALHPTDRFAYVLGGAEGGPARLGIFKYYAFSPLVIDVEKTGIPETPALECACNELELDHSGRFLYLADPSGEVRAWYLDTLSGQPRPMAGGRVKLEAGQLQLLADPLRSQLYVLNPERRQLLLLVLDPEQGRLVRVAELALPALPLDLVVDPSGRRAWLSLADNKLVIIEVSDKKLTIEKTIKVPGPLTDMLVSRVLQ